MSGIISRSVYGHIYLIDDYLSMWMTQNTLRNFRARQCQTINLVDHYSYSFSMCIYEFSRELFSIDRYVCMTIINFVVSIKMKNLNRKYCRCDNLMLFDKTFSFRTRSVISIHAIRCTDAFLIMIRDTEIGSERLVCYDRSNMSSCHHWS